jgi:hypothetical protein
MIDDECGAVGGMRIGKPTPPQIPHDLTWDRTKAAAVGRSTLKFTEGKKE